MASAFQQPVDEDVLRGARDGDLVAHEKLYRQFAPAVYNLAYRICGSRDQAQDVLQETFLDMLRHISGFRGDAPAGMWIRKIAVNRALGSLRSPWHRLRSGEEPMAPALQDRWSPEGIIDIEAMLHSLPPLARAVVWLHDVEGFTHEEIAVQLGRTASFSKSQLARAYSALRRRAGDLTEVEACMPASNNS